jgi:hypothetical protein
MPTPIEDRVAKLRALSEELRQWAYDDKTASQSRYLNHAAEHCASAAEYLKLVIAEEAPTPPTSGAGPSPTPQG